MGSATLRNFTDVHVTSASPDATFSTQHMLRTAGTTEYAYLYCPRPFPLGATVTSATLRLYAAEAAASRTMRVQQIATAKTLTRITFNSQPALTGSVVSVTKVPVAGGAWDFDVTAHMQAVAAGGGWYGWRLSSSTTSLLRFWSANSTAGLHPVLIVEWSDAPSRPTGLTPAGNLAVSLAKPTLSYTFTDVSGDTTLAGHRVQIHTEPITTGTPQWDSGDVATTVPAMDLAATTFPGVTAGQSRWWRVRARDGAGLWSDWAPWVQWQCVAKPKVTLTYPPHEGVVETPTPVVRWSVAPSTQASYQVDVLDGLRTVVWTSGKVASTTARAHAIPAGVLRKDDARYYIRLLVWDTTPRVGIPGDPSHVEAAAHVHFDRDGSLTPVTDTTATPTPEQVGMVLSWARTQAPDGWAILRDGLVVAVIDRAADASTGGITYSWTDWCAHPRRDHTWEVAPIIAGVTGRGTPVPGRLNPVGLWLVHVDSGTLVKLHNTGDDLGWSSGEESAVHNPLAARAPVLITQGLRGYEGPVKGQLVETHDLAPLHGSRTAQQWRDEFLELRARPGAVLRLAVNDQNIPVVAWNLTLSPHPMADRPRFDASLDFAQVDEFDYHPDL